ncbi:predicted protein [Histoplasma capsulatum G186AR]|uniref:Uncharacterized protein n=1 Tax=Ajellomyces capsulatus (strain G186AR / H82 / ATCC MYA-2454 / RMSCC 2432) TaxID=447093 RepID=C0NJC9_AJECG|nr:uncharacterized protein HCBG_03259 [Histoplasma capsulatum G186AR]EEH07970.1 predicted protein [Histoplasma capsulatum G186AR]
MEGKPPAYDSGSKKTLTDSAKLDTTQTQTQIHSTSPSFRTNFGWWLRNPLLYVLPCRRNNQGIVPNKLPPRQYGPKLISIKGARPISIFGRLNVSSSSQKAAHLCMHKYGMFSHRSSSRIGIPEGKAVWKTGILVQGFGYFTIALSSDPNNLG